MCDYERFIFDAWINNIVSEISWYSYRDVSGWEKERVKEKTGGKFGLPKLLQSPAQCPSSRLSIRAKRSVILSIRQDAPKTERNHSGFEVDRLEYRNCWGWRRAVHDFGCWCWWLSGRNVSEASFHYCVLFLPIMLASTRRGEGVGIKNSQRRTEFMIWILILCWVWDPTDVLPNRLLGIGWGGEKILAEVFRAIEAFIGIQLAEIKIEKQNDPR